MTNLSRLIDHVLCRSCGKCCESFTIVYFQDEAGEIERFRNLDTDLIEVIDERDRTKVVFKMRCKQLRTENGLKSCAIYNSPKRPMLCRLYPFKEDLECPYKKTRRNSMLLNSENKDI